MNLHSKIVLTPTCALEMYARPPELLLNYVERSSDHWHSDTETEVAITLEQAIEIKKMIDAFLSLTCLT